MIRNYCLLIALLLSIELCGQQPKSITTFIILRHAEKADDGSRDPDLNAEGVARANKISSMFKETKIDAIYSTNYKRTRNTVAALAQHKQLEIQTYDPSKVDDIEQMLMKHSGGTVLICGHSNTVPKAVNFLIGKEDYQNFRDDDYGNIMVVSVLEKGKSANVVWMKY